MKQLPIWSWFWIGWLRALAIGMAARAAVLESGWRMLAAATVMGLAEVAAAIYRHQDRKAEETQ